MNIFFNMKHNFKRKLVLVTTPFLFISLTSCEKRRNENIGFLPTSGYNYEDKDENEIIDIIFSNNDLYQANDIFHSKCDNETFNYIKESYYKAISVDFYNSVKKAYDDYLEYNSFFEENYSKDTNKKIKDLYNLYSNYLYAYKNNNSYNVYNYYKKITCLLNEFSINDILNIKFNISTYNNINPLDNSLLCTLIKNNDNDINYKVRYLFNILYSNYEIENGNLKQSGVNALNILYRKIEPKIEDEVEVEDDTKIYSYHMDSDGILWTKE